MKEFQVIALSDVEKARVYILEHLVSYLERQTYAEALRKGIETLGSDFLSKIISLGQERSKQSLSSLVDHCVRLECTLRLLHKELENQWNGGGIYLQEVIFRSDQIAKKLASVMVELEYFSSHDFLTGLHNRRYFNEMLDHEISRSLRHHHTFSILMLDIDNFKVVNDSYGHSCGDRVLQSLAMAMRTNLRKGDVASRIGGDEFSIILMETSQKGGKNVAEKIRRLVEGLPFETQDGHHFHTTVSIGVVSYPKHAKSAEELMTWADACLYRAKAEGKNRAYALIKKPRAILDRFFNAIKKVRP